MALLAQLVFYFIVLDLGNFLKKQLLFFLDRGGGQMVGWTIQYDMIQYDTIQYDTIQYDMIQYDTTQHDTIQYDTIQFNAIQCKEEANGLDKTRNKTK